MTLKIFLFLSDLKFKFVNRWGAKRNARKIVRDAQSKLDKLIMCNKIFDEKLEKYEVALSRLEKKYKKILK